MDTLPRHFVVLAFLPVAIVALTLAALFVYHQGAEERRDRWQQPDAVFDAIGVGQGMRVAEWHPTDTYFLARLTGRVGESGSVYAVGPSSRVAQDIERGGEPVVVVSEIPSALDVLLILDVRSAGLDQIEEELTEAGGKLRRGARVGYIGVRGDHDQTIESDVLVEAARNRGLRLVSDEDFLDRQYLLVLERE